MREWIEDAIGVICLFGIGYGVALFLYGAGWQ